MSTNTTTTFGKWLQARRRECDLTQNKLAQRVGCAEISIRKIEADQLRPSRRLAHMLLQELIVPLAQRENLVRLARQR